MILIADASALIALASCDSLAVLDALFGTVVAFTRVDQGDFISLTDIAKVKNASEPKDVVIGVEFDSFKLEAGTNSFTLSPSKWIEATGAIGIKLAASSRRACVTC